MVVPLLGVVAKMYVFLTAEIAKHAEKNQVLPGNTQILCELGVLCGKFPYQHSTGALPKL